MFLFFENSIFFDEFLFFENENQDHQIKISTNVHNMTQGNNKQFLLENIQIFTL